jgi:hypothetical protein
MASALELELEKQSAKSSFADAEAAQLAQSFANK